MYVHPFVNWWFELLDSIGYEWIECTLNLITAFTIMTLCSEEYYYTAVDCYSYTT